MARLVQRRVLRVGGCATVELRWGASPASPARRSSLAHTLVMLPGNPGAADYYSDFLDEIGDVCAAEGLEVVCVGHAGHSVLPPGHAMPPPMDLAAQVRHKTAYVEHLLREAPARRLVLAGHSIGAYMALQVLRALPDAPIDKVYLLLPTLHHIGDTPRGRQITPIVAPVPRSILAFVAGGFASLPEWLRVRVVQAASGQAPEHAAVAANLLLHPKVAYNCFFMGHDEMHTLRELDEDVIRKNVRKLSFWYGRDDGWVPREHYTSMRAAFPDADIRLCRAEVPHAFVLDQARPFGQTIGRDLQRFLQQSQLLDVTERVEHLTAVVEMTAHVA